MKRGILGAVLLASCWTGLNHDVRYVLGCLRAANRGGFSASETFVHRPMAYRWLLHGLDSLTVGPLVLREALLRLLVLLVIVATAFWLRAALRGHLPEAGPVALAAGLALAFAPAWDFLQPEWVAAVAATAAVAAALWFRALWAAAFTGGLLLAVTVLVKYTTASTALIVVAVVAAFQWRRALSMAVAGALMTVALFGLTVWMEPREWRWLTEFSHLNAGTPLQVGFGRSQAADLAGALLNETLLVPVVALLPTALLLLRQRGLYALAAVSVLSAVAALIVQGQWFLYHLAALPVFAAGLLALALTRARPPRALTYALVLLLPAVTVVGAAPPSWRQTHGTPVYVTLLVFMAATALLAGRTVISGPQLLLGHLPPREPATDTPTRLQILGRPIQARGGRMPVLTAPLLLALLCVVPALPNSPYSFDSRHADYTPWERFAARDRTVARLDQVRASIGADTPVAYLAFGDVAYLLGNPAECRYPSPVFLQRTSSLPHVDELESFGEGLSCLDHGRYAVIDTRWFPLAHVDRQARERLRTGFDCSVPVYKADELLVCRRAGQ